MWTKHLLKCGCHWTLSEYAFLAGISEKSNAVILFEVLLKVISAVFLCYKVALSL